MKRTDAIQMLLTAALVALLSLNDAQRMQPVNVEAAVSPAQARPTLRVGLWTLWHDREAAIVPVGKATVHSCEQCATRALIAPETIRAEGNHILIKAGETRSPSTELRFDGTFALTAHGEHLTLHNPLAITAHAGVLMLVVTMPIESYAERVVASESGPGDSSESLKALAIVVRTFALHEAHGHADYDLCDSTHCQLLHWGGNGTRAAAAHSATLATAGETLWFHGQRALAYFNKDCGGRTAAVQEIWPHARPVPYLASRPDRYCTADGGSEWASEATHAELTTALAMHGLVVPGWRILAVAQRGVSGRAILLRVDQTEISAEDFRIAVGESLGWNRMPSTWFEVAQQGKQFEFHGRGWGHGVGLCQKGAARMAAQGRSTPDILAQYFPGAIAADEQTGRAWQSYTSSELVLETLDPSDRSFMPQLAQARAEASQRSGLNSATPFTVRAFPSTDRFRSATLTPGWVAAFTEGEWIGTQPLRTLAGRQLLVSTLRHEFLHGLVEQQAGPSAPLWLREGLVEAWSDPDGQNASVRGAAPMLTVKAVDSALAHPASETESTSAHRAAGWYAAQLLMHYGRGQVLSWLRSGVPAGPLAGLGQR